MNSPIWRFFVKELLSKFTKLLFVLSQAISIVRFVMASRYNCKNHKQMFSAAYFTRNPPRKLSISRMTVQRPLSVFCPSSISGIIVRMDTVFNINPFQSLPTKSLIHLFQKTSQKIQSQRINLLSTILKYLSRLINTELFHWRLWLPRSSLDGRIQAAALQCSTKSSKRSWRQYHHMKQLFGKLLPTSYRGISSTLSKTQR